MGENARSKNGHARVETRVLKTLACRNGFWSKWFLDLFQAMVDSVSVGFKNACRKNAFKHSYAVECGNRLRVGVRAKKPSVSGVCVSALLRFQL